jgi:hypothetical protein
MPGQLKYFLPLLGYVEIRGNRAEGKGIREKDGMEINVRKDYRNGTTTLGKLF